MLKNLGPQTRRNLAQDDLCFRGFTSIVPFKYRVAHTLHGSLGGLPSLVGTRIEDIPNLLWMRFKFFAACLNGLDPFDQVVSHRILAFHAPNAGGAATLIGPRNYIGRRE